ncbi:transglutaminase domain-containing protein [Psychroserpens damuponensis]|uniref:transglutaminase domain-containing protein n=1 Tax=Psychroserpens damuponensis TaxID=943936 RepID=UPI00059094E9|nr:transglutaminase domain-containing protein [Psychroserpens damuponensis]
MRYLLLFIVAFQSHAQISDFDHINFSKADLNASICKNEGLDNMPNLVYNLTSNLDTDVERFRAIYMWVCHNIANDYTLYLKNKRKRSKYQNDSVKLKSWNNRFKKDVFRKLLKQNKTICTGYAYIVKELAKLANLECEIVHGYGRTSMTNIDELDPPNHSWNAIKLNEKWYLCDPTWASGIPDPETKIFKFDYNNGYFLSNPQLFIINHFPQEEHWTLMPNESHTFDEFLAAPILYGQAYTYLSTHDYPKLMHQSLHKNEMVQFQYKLQNDIDVESVRFLIDNGYTNKKTTPNSVNIENKSLIIEHQFESNGFYDVHLYIGNDLISTYTFKVKG